MSRNTKKRTSSDTEEWITKRKCKEKSTRHILDIFKQKDILFGLLTNSIGEIKKILRDRNYSYIRANDLNYPVVELIVNNNKNTENLNLSQKRYYKFLIDYRDYLIRPNGKPVPILKNNAILGSAYRRACKILVRTANAIERVHFELSDIDMQRVCNKEKSDLGVTNSELRAAYRQAKENGNNPHLFFYMNGKSCPPPWEQVQYQQYWENYNKLREAKKARKAGETTKIAIADTIASSSSKLPQSRP